MLKSCWWLGWGSPIPYGSKAGQVKKGAAYFVDAKQLPSNRQNLNPLQPGILHRKHNWSAASLPSDCVICSFTIRYNWSPAPRWYGECRLDLTALPARDSFMEGVAFPTPPLGAQKTREERQWETGNFPWAADCRGQETLDAAAVADLFCPLRGLVLSWSTFCLSMPCFRSGMRFAGGKM